MRFLPLLFFICTGIFANSFYCQESAIQGEPVTFVIVPEKGNYSYTFSIYKDKKKILTFNSFNHYFIDEKIPVILGIGAIPPNLEPGEYIVKAKGKGFLESFFFERKFEVLAGEYETRILNANGKMDKLSNGKRDPKRDEQAKKWWETISNFNKYSFHHTGKLNKPIAQARRSSPYGFKRVIKYPSGKSSNTIHYGEDFAIEEGTPIYSDGNGKVVLSEERIISGNTVIVEHLPGIFTLYYHMNTRVLKVGDRIKTGDLIGTVGSTGYSTGPHLHWEIRIGTIPVNPNYFLTRSIIDKSLIMNMIIDTNTKKGG